MTRRSGRFAVGIESADGGYILNTGGAYGGEVYLDGPIRLRLGQPGDELVMLREHDRARVIGSWTGVRVDGRRVVASGIRWADTADAAEARALVDGGHLRAASIGFSGLWSDASSLTPEERASLAERGADLARLQTVVRDVEVYEASLVAVGADEGARWSMDGGDDGAADDVRRLMVRHLIDHHGLSAGDALAYVVGDELLPEAPEPVQVVEPDPADPAPVEAALYDVPAAIRAAAEQGLQWVRDGLGGDGLTETGPATARALASGRVDAERVLLIAAWWARFGEVDGPLERDGEPTPLAVARALWGGDDADAWASGLADDARAEVSDASAAETALSAEPTPLALWLAGGRPAPSPLTAWWSGLPRGSTPRR